LYSEKAARVNSISIYDYGHEHEYETGHDVPSLESLELVLSEAVLVIVVGKKISLFFGIEPFLVPDACGPPVSSVSKG
jgi:hypothetical protein